MTLAVVDMVRTHNNVPYIFGRYVKPEAENRDKPITEPFTLVVDGKVNLLNPANTLADALGEISSVLTPGSELMVSGGSGDDPTAEIRIRIPTSALGKGGLAFIIRHLHETGNPTHLANWSEFHGEHATVPAGLKDREPVPA